MKRAIAALLLFTAGVVLVPAHLSGREARALYGGDAELQASLGRGVLDALRGEMAFATGSARFDGEWRFGTYMMAAMGFGQVAHEHGSRDVAAMDLSVDAMLRPEVARFDAEAWGEDALVSLDGGRGHAAYLGYTNLALGMHRLVEPASRFAPMNDRVSDALARRLERSPIGLVETYPREVYPVDNAAVIASLALRDRAAGDHAHAATIARALARLRAEDVDPASGLLVQRVDAETGRAIDAPRGSGTMLAVYFLAYADAALSRDLWTAASRALAGSAIGFGLVREYPPGQAGGGDIDSGPIAGGFGVSATGFALAGARVHGDLAQYARLYATVSLFGAPVEGRGARRWVTGGPLGDAIVFAMATAHRSAS